MAAQPAKVLLLLRYEEVEHRLKIIRGTPKHELLSDIREVLGLAPGLPIEFRDEDNDRTLLSSYIDSGTRLTVISSKRGCGGDVHEMPPHMNISDTEAPQNSSGNAGATSVEGVAGGVRETPQQPPQEEPEPESIEAQVAAMLREKKDEVIGKLRTATCDIGTTLADRLARAPVATKERSDLNELFSIFKVVSNELRDPTEARSLHSDGSDHLKAACAPLRDVLLLSCVHHRGFMTSEEFLEVVLELLGPEFIGQLTPKHQRNLSSSFKHSHKKIISDHFHRRDLCIQRRAARNRRARTRNREPEPEQAAASNTPSETDPYEQVPADVPMRIDDTILGQHAFQTSQHVAHMRMPEPVRLHISNTFVDMIDEAESIREEQSSLSALTFSAGPHQFSRADKKQVDGLMKDMANRSLSPEVFGNRAQSLCVLLTRMHHAPASMAKLRPDSLVVAARCRATDPANLEKIMGLLAQVLGPDFMQEMEPLLQEFEDPKAVAICCRALGTFVQADGRHVAFDVVAKLLTAMSRFQADVDVQEACLDGLVKVMRASQEILGLQAARHPCDSRLPKETRSKIARVAQEALRRSPGCSDRGIRTIARIQPAHLVVDAALGCEHPSQVLAAALDEVIWDLAHPLNSLRSTYEADEAEKTWAISLLREVGRQKKAFKGSINVTDWVFCTATSARMAAHITVPMRLTLAGLLFGIEEEVLTPMEAACAALDDEQPTETVCAQEEDVLTPMDGTFAEWSTETVYAQEVMHAGCAALVHHNHIEPFGSNFASKVKLVRRVSACMKSLMQKGCDVEQRVRSAFAGFKGDLMSGIACEASEVAEEEVKDVLEVAQLGLADWCVEEAFFNCLLWALTEIFKGAPSLGKQQKDIQSLAKRLHKNMLPLKKNGKCNDDQATVLELTACLMNWPPKKTLTPSH